MDIAVISDTHLHQTTPWFEAVFARYLSPADMLIHCGDATGRGVWSHLLQHPGSHGVCGNMDDYALSAELPDRLNLSIEGLTVGACHGWGVRQGLSARIAQAFGPEYDVVFFGHSHAREDSLFGGTRLINPGSLQQGRGEFAMVRIKDGSVEVDFCRVDDKELGGAFA